MNSPQSRTVKRLSAITPLTLTNDEWRIAYISIRRTLGQHRDDEITLEAIKHIGINNVEMAFFPDDVANRIQSTIVEYDKQWSFIDEWK